MPDGFLPTAEHLSRGQIDSWINTAIEEVYGTRDKMTILRHHTLRQDFLQKFLTSPKFFEANSLHFEGDELTLESKNYLHSIADRAFFGNLLTFLYESQKEPSYIEDDLSVHILTGPRHHEKSETKWRRDVFIQLLFYLQGIGALFIVPQPILNAMILKMWEEYNHTKSKAIFDSFKRNGISERKIEDADHYFSNKRQVQEPAPYVKF